MAQGIAAFFSLLINFFVEMPSTVDLCKRALVTLIRALAVAYGVRVAVTRDATDQVIKRAYRTTPERTQPRPPRERARSLRGKSVEFSGRSM